MRFDKLTIPVQSDMAGELPSCGLLADLSSEHRQELAKRGYLETCPVGDYVTRQGELHHALSVVIEGKLTVSCHAHGDYVDLAELGPGQTVGEMSLLDPQNSSADVRVADRPARLWTIDGDVFNEFVESNKSIGFAFMKALGKEMCQRLRQNSDHMLHQADELRTHFRDIDF